MGYLDALGGWLNIVSCIVAFLGCYGDFINRLSQEEKYALKEYTEVQVCT